MLYLGVVLLSASTLLLASAYNVGVGIYDVTGPSVEVNFMGYAAPGQRGEGIHIRLRARSFAMSEDDGSKMVVYVNVDGGMASDLVTMKVVDEVNKELGPNTISTDNLAISGTHTHSGPAGYLQYTLFQITSLGYVKETLDAWVSGISNSVIMAIKDLKPAKINIAEGKLYDSNINRSPSSYLLNPQEERDQYEDGDTDKNMMLLKFVSQDTQEPVGILNWFAVHGTCMNNTNKLVSGDNKGYAAYKLEKDANGPSSKPGMGPFVAGFSSTNLGDVSPNTAGPKCIDTGLPCDGSNSTCNGRCEKCIAFGPGKNGDMVESTQIIGNNQYEFAKKLMDSATEEISGPIDFRHSFVQMNQLTVTLESGEKKTLCSPAMGYAFAAGTTDGPGMFDFTQGSTSGNRFWDLISGFLSKPTDEEKECQAPKPILLNTGDVAKPYEWDPVISPVQILRVGNLFILAAPCELTTMAGRRLRKAVHDIIKDSGICGDQEVYVTIGGLANNYASYVATYEEYQAQRYEAASTIFGPHTLEGYIQEFSRIARDMVSGQPSLSGPSPPDLSDVQIQLAPTVKFDRVPIGSKFGHVVKGQDVKSSYLKGETVEATFHAACPRNDQHAQGTYLTVERLQDGSKDQYDVVAVDGDWETRFRWWAGKEDPYALGFSAVSKAQLSWIIPSDAQSGTYRLCYFGDHKNVINGHITPFSGCSGTFIVN